MVNCKYEKITEELTQMLEDIIDIAYKDSSSLENLKTFRIILDDRNLKTRLGDYNKVNGIIRIFHLQNEAWQDTIVTLLHEASHHIDNIFRGMTNHDKNFYEIHKCLIYTAFDMNIISKADVVVSTTTAQNKNKLAAMIKDYIPKNIDYKNGTKTIHVYNAFSVRKALTAQGYQWNDIDKSFEKNIDVNLISDEKKYLYTLGICDSQVLLTSGTAVITRLHKNVFIYNVKYPMHKVLIELNYVWNVKNQCWNKKILSDSLSQDELDVLNNIQNIKIVVR